MPTFAALLGGQKKMKVATLIDIQAKDRQAVENLYKRKLLQKKNVLTFADFTSTPEADVEDMFEVGFYLKLVNGDYGPGLAAPIEESDLTEKHPRVLVRLSRFFEKMPLEGQGPFQPLSTGEVLRRERVGALEVDLDGDPGPLRGGLQAAQLLARMSHSPEAPGSGGVPRGVVLPAVVLIVISLVLWARVRIIDEIPEGDESPPVPDLPDRRFAEYTLLSMGHVAAIAIE